MRTEQPNVIHLKDYQAPDYLIDETALTFELHEDHTLVHAQLVMRRNAERADGTLPALVLDGQQLELLSLSMDDRELGATDYQLTDSHLTARQPVNEDDNDADRAVAAELEQIDEAMPAKLQLIRTQMALVLRMLPKVRAAANEAVRTLT